MFVVLGVVTILIGAWTYLCLPDTPMKASFLEEKEIVRVLERVSENQTGVENRQFKMSQAIELAQDPQIYLMLMVTVLVSPKHTSIMATANVFQVFCFKRCHHHILCHSHQELRILFPYSSSA